MTTWTAYDGANAYADFNGSGALQTRYLHGPAVDMLLARTSAAGTTAWYLTDRLGSVRDLANTSGAVIDHLAYDGFGKLLSESSPANGDRFGYTGRERDAVSGLQFNRGRYYDAAIGRWTQEDSIGFDGGDPNLARYVGNSPTNATDPSGLQGILTTVGGWAGDICWGAFDTVAEVPRLGYDLARCGVQTTSLGTNALGLTGVYQYKPSSYLVSGMFQNADRNGNGLGTAYQYSAGAGANFIANGSTFGVYGMGQGVYEGYQTGNYKNFRRSIGGAAVAVGAFKAAGGQFRVRASQPTAVGVGVRAPVGLPRGFNPVKGFARAC